MDQNTTTFEINGLAELDGVSAELIKMGQKSPVWLFFGDMGAGKTTLIKVICKQLGVSGNIQSPTFSLVNEYTTENGDLAYHFDFYRIKQESEALDMGIEEYLDSGSFCFIEWPEKIQSLWPNHYTELTLTTKDVDKRVLTIRLISK
jgi:tRNA threonylcarbamoyladenosine biosynthesis protein TsaE